LAVYIIVKMSVKAINEIYIV